VPAVHPWCYAHAYPVHRRLARVLREPHDAFHANDCNALPHAARAARAHGARLVLDLHEFAPLEFENQPDWSVYEPMIRATLRRHAPRADAVLTVAPAIADRYRDEFGLDPVVLLNAPEAVPVPPRAAAGETIHLVHHGIASPVRRPEVMIDALARCDRRYVLHFMLMPGAYVDALRGRAGERAPGRVFFHDAVPPEQIVPALARFDVGLNVIAPTNYNYLVCLPTKMFEGIAAGLAICTGPSPSMAELVRRHGCGIVAPSFEADDLADALNRVKTPQWRALQAAARQAAGELNAAREMQKLVDIYSRLLGVPAAGAARAA
jgi:glycosyltransferase involved in cell wall biosynthesis